MLFLCYSLVWWSWVLSFEFHPDFECYLSVLPIIFTESHFSIPWYSYVSQVWLNQQIPWKSSCFKNMMQQVNKRSSFLLRTNCHTMDTGMLCKTNKYLISYGIVTFYEDIIQISSHLGVKRKFTLERRLVTLWHKHLVIMK